MEVENGVLDSQLFGGRSRATECLVFSILA